MKNEEFATAFVFFILFPIIYDVNYGQIHKNHKNPIKEIVLLQSTNGLSANHPYKQACR